MFLVSTYQKKKSTMGVLIIIISTILLYSKQTVSVTRVIQYVISFIIIHEKYIIYDLHLSSCAGTLFDLRRGSLHIIHHFTMAVCARSDFTCTSLSCHARRCPNADDRIDRPVFKRRAKTNFYIFG